MVRGLMRGIPGKSDARRPIVVIAVNQRARISAAERAGFAGSDNGHGRGGGIQVEIGDVIVQLDGRGLGW